jgi:hypothetical protein
LILGVGTLRYSQLLTLLLVFLSYSYNLPVGNKIRLLSCIYILPLHVLYNNYSDITMLMHIKATLLTTRMVLWLIALKLIYRIFQTLPPKLTEQLWRVPIKKIIQKLIKEIRLLIRQIFILILQQLTDLTNEQIDSILQQVEQLADYIMSDIQIPVDPWLEQQLAQIIKQWILKALESWLLSYLRQMITSPFRDECTRISVTVYKSIENKLQPLLLLAIQLLLQLIIYIYFTSSYSQMLVIFSSIFARCDLTCLLFDF